MEKRDQNSSEGAPRPKLMKGLIGHRPDLRGTAKKLIDSFKWGLTSKKKTG